MAFTVEQLGNEPIVILTIKHPITDYIQETIDSDAAVAAIGKHIQGNYYRIADMRDFTLDFNGILAWLNQQRQRSPGSINDPQIVSLLVSTEENSIASAKFAAQEQYGGQKIQIFSTLDEAISHARQGAEL
jgi:hypothetical protein